MNHETAKWLVRVAPLIILAVLFTTRLTAAERPVVVLVELENETGDPGSAHWGQTAADLIEDRLYQLKSLRLVDKPLDWCFTQLKLKPGQSLSFAEGLELGRLLRADHFVSGNYQRHGTNWHVHVRVLRIQTAQESVDLDAEAPDWFEITHSVSDQISHQLHISPARAESASMKTRWPSSAKALEVYSQARALGRSNAPPSEMVKAYRKVISIDARFAWAYYGLAQALAEQGDYPGARESARQGTLLKPDQASGHEILGWVSELQQDYPEAERQYRKAVRRTPDEAWAWRHLAEAENRQGKEQEAIAAWTEASRLDTTSAETHALLALAYAKQQDVEKAKAELRKAQDLNADEDYTEQLIARAYEALHDLPAAEEHYEKLIASARRQGVAPERYSCLEQRALELKKRLTPVYLTAPMPIVFAEADLHRRLTSKECRRAINPLVATAPMTNWAKELTRNAEGDLSKAKDIFSVLARRVQRGPGGSRTAEEVFSVWNDPKRSFSCQEFAKLFIALARAVGTDAYYVHLEKDYAGRVVYHDCAALFTAGGTLLVDPAYQWFGVPHKDFLVLNDLQVIAHQLFQSGEVKQCQLAAKLHPDFAWGQVILAQALVNAKRPREAQEALKMAFKLDPGRWDAYQVQARLAYQKRDWTEAAASFKQAVDLNPENGSIRCELGYVLQMQGKFKEAHDQFTAALKTDLEPHLKKYASARLAEIKEQLDAK